MGVFRSDEVWGRAREEFPRSLIVFDEPTTLSLRMVASLQSPLPFRLANYCSSLPHLPINSTEEAFFSSLAVFTVNN